MAAPNQSLPITTSSGLGYSAMFRAKTSASNTEFVAGLESMDQSNRVEFYGQYLSNNIVGRSVANGQWTTTGTLDSSKNSWHIYEDKWCSEYVEFDMDDANLASTTTNTPNVTGPRPLLGPWNIGTLTIDWYLVRKYTAHEPIPISASVPSPSPTPTPTPTPTPNPMPGYNYVKSHTITGSSDGAQTNYQVKFVVHSGSGTDSGQDVYLNGHSLSWPNDVRFTNAANTTLNFWIEFIRR